MCIRDRQGGEQQFNMMMMMQTRQMLVQGYALDALFRHEGLVVSDEDVQEACAAMNPQNPQGVRRQMEESGRGFALREAAERIKANKWLLEHADITAVSYTHLDVYKRQVMNTPTKIGDTVQITEGSQDVDDVLATRTYQVVGYVHSSYYVSSTSMGTTSLGSGSVQQFMYVPESDFSKDLPYTEAFVTVAGAAGEFSGSDAYFCLLYTSRCV